MSMCLNFSDRVISWDCVGSISGMTNVPTAAVMSSAIAKDQNVHGHHARANMPLKTEPGFYQSVGCLRFHKLIHVGLTYYSTGGRTSAK